MNVARRHGNLLILSPQTLGGLGILFLTETSKSWIYTSAITYVYCEITAKPWMRDNLAMVSQLQ